MTVFPPRIHAFLSSLHCCLCWCHCVVLHVSCPHAENMTCCIDDIIKKYVFLPRKTTKIIVRVAQ